MNEELICGLLADYSKELSETEGIGDKGRVQIKHARKILESVRSSAPKLYGIYYATGVLGRNTEHVKAFTRNQALEIFWQGKNREHHEIHNVFVSDTDLFKPGPLKEV